MVETRKSLKRMTTVYRVNVFLLKQRLSNKIANCWHFGSSCENLVPNCLLFEFLSSSAYRYIHDCMIEKYSNFGRYVEFCTDPKIVVW